MDKIDRNVDYLEQLLSDDEEHLQKNEEKASEEKGEEKKEEGKVELPPDEDKPLKKKRITYKESHLVGEDGMARLYHDMPRHIPYQISNSNQVCFFFIFFKIYFSMVA